MKSQPLFFPAIHIYQTTGKKTKPLFRQHMKPHHRVLQRALPFIMRPYIAQQSLTLKVSSYPTPNYSIYMHATGLNLTPNSLTE